MDDSTYLYETIYRDLARKIADGTLEPGAKIPTEQELSDQYQVSRITSKRALNLLAENGLVLRRRGLGTFVASSHAKKEEPAADAGLLTWPEKPTRHVGVLMEDLGESYSQGLFYTLDHLATQDGVQVSLAISYGDQSMERTRLRQLLSYQVDGLLVMPAHGSYYDTDLLRLVLAHFPVVLIDRPLAGIPAPSVYSDNVGGARKLTELLLQKGHTNIAYASTDTSETISLEDRYNGYVQTMRGHGLQDLPLFSVDKLVRFVASISRLTIEPAEPPEQLAIQNWLGANPHITAVIGSEFGIAHMVKKAALRLGRRVPEDLAICCFDEKYGYLGEFEFTHIRQDEAALARKALDVLYAMLDGKNMRRQRFVIPTHLHEGSTT